MEDIIDHYSSLLNGKLVGLDRGPERPLWAFYMLGGARPLWRSLQVAASSERNSKKKV